MVKNAISKPCQLHCQLAILDDSLLGHFNFCHNCRCLLHPAKESNLSKHHAGLEMDAYEPVNTASNSNRPQKQYDGIETGMKVKPIIPAVVNVNFLAHGVINYQICLYAIRQSYHRTFRNPQ